MNSLTPSPARRAFTLVELLVVIAIVIILMALLLPAITSSQGQKNRTECINNQQQIGKARLTIGPQLVNSTNWIESISNHLDGETRSFQCPVDLDRNASIPSSYGMNHRAQRFGDEDANRIVLLDYRKTEAKLVVSSLADQDDWTEENGEYAARHMQSVNVLFHDGSVRSKTAESIDPRVCELWTSYWRPYRDQATTLDGCLGESSEQQAPPNGTTDPAPEEEEDPWTPSEEEDSGKCEVSNLQEMDNGDPGFTLPPGGGWNLRSGYSWGGYQDDHHAVMNLQNESEATYEFDVEPGKHIVWALWPGRDDNATSMHYVIYDDETSAGVVQIDQTVDPGEQWKRLGEFEITSRKLRVGVRNPGGGSFFDIRNVIADAIRVDCSVETTEDYAKRCSGMPPKTVDNSDPLNFSATAGWSTFNGPLGYGGDWASAASGSGSAEATYRFPDVPRGVYRVWVMFEPRSDQASDTPFTVLSGERVVRTIHVNQAKAYHGTVLASDPEERSWLLLGKFDVGEGNVRVVVGDAASGGSVVADAVRIDCDDDYDSEEDEACSEYDPYAGRECRRRYDDSGASNESEEAIERAFNWLSKHQLPDGGWNFDHHQGDGSFIQFPSVLCAGKCDNSVKTRSNCRIAATSLGLLPFLGVGYGPEDGIYGDVVAAGINYLLSHNGGEVKSSGKIYSQGGNNSEGYEQGMGTLALVEALAICQQSGFGDVSQNELQQAATAAVARLGACQGMGTQGEPWSNSGGWAYNCGDTGNADSSVTTWAVQAMIAAGLSGLPVPHADWKSKLNSGFMESIAGHGEPITDSYGSFTRDYMYHRQRANFCGSASADAQGLFLRVYTGSPSGAQAFQEAAESIAGGEPPGMYQAYYTHHFMRKVGGGHFDAWDTKMKAYLLEEYAPATEGHEEGSWHVPDGFCVRGEVDRLFNTVMASLCLEIYYRQLNSFN